VTIELVSRENAQDILNFEIENRLFFNSFVSARPERYYEPEYFMELINSIVAEQREGLCYMYVIRRADGEMVGRVNLFGVTEEPVPQAELGYRVGERHQGQGYATKAVALALQEGFVTYGLQRIEAGTSQENMGSQNVLLKNGFNFIGRSSEGAQVNGQLVGSLEYVKNKEVVVKQ
jgi:ribosomal-protein-alanine N-acetyltransferase